MSRDEMYYFGWLKCYEVNPTKTAREATARFPEYEPAMKRALTYTTAKDAFKKVIRRCLGLR